MSTPATDPAIPPNTPGHRNLPQLTLDQAADLLERDRAGES